MYSDIKFYDNHSIECYLGDASSKRVIEMINDLKIEYNHAIKGKILYREEVDHSETTLRIFIQDPDFHTFCINKRLINVEKKGPKIFSLKRSFVTQVEDQSMSNILKIMALPKEISLSVVKARFENFASDKVTTHIKHVKGCKIRDTYPFVSMDSDRNVYIVFDPNKTDASFALLMTATMKIKDYKLTVTHSFRTKKDIVSEIRRRKSHLKEMKKQAECCNLLENAR